MKLYKSKEKNYVTRKKIDVKENKYKEYIMEEFKEYVNTYIHDHDSDANELTIFFIMKTNELLSGGHHHTNDVVFKEDDVHKNKSIATAKSTGNPMRSNEQSSKKGSNEQSSKKVSNEQSLTSRVGKQTKDVELTSLLNNPYDFNNYKKIFRILTNNDLTVSKPTDRTNKNIEAKMPENLKPLWTSYKLKMPKSGGTRKLRSSRRRRL